MKRTRSGTIRETRGEPGMTRKLAAVAVLFVVLLEIHMLLEIRRNKQLNKARASVELDKQ